MEGGRASFDIDSLMGKRRYDGWLAYNQTKNADVMIALELSELWRDMEISVNCVFPGLVKTAILGGISRIFASPSAPCTAAPAKPFPGRNGSDLGRHRARTVRGFRQALRQLRGQSSS